MKNRRIWKQLSAVLLALAVVTGGFSVKIGNFVIWDMAIVAHAYDNVDLFAIYDQAAQFWQNQSNNLDDATRQNLSDSMRVVQTLILSDNPSSEDVNNGYTMLNSALSQAKMQAGSFEDIDYVNSTCANGVVTAFTALRGNGYGSVNSELGGYYSSDSQYYKMLVDGNKNTKWCVEDWSNKYQVNTYLEFKCDNGSFVPTGYILTTGKDSATYTGRNPKSWRIDGKKNQWDEDWTPLVSVTNDQVLEDENSKAYLFRFANTEEYQYFRFYTNEVQNGTIFQLAELQLLDDSFTLTKQEVKDATCTEDGNKITHYKGSDGKYYIARYGDNNEIAGYAEVAKEDAIIDALGHQFDGDNPEWNWTKNENGSYTVKAHAECSRCHLEKDFDATVTSTVTTPTYAEDGKTVYTATVNIWGVDYTDTKEEAILANRDDVTYIGADGTEQTINAVEITGIMNRLTAGNYVVNDSNITISSVVNVTGDVVLILADGGKMSANKGIKITNGSLSIYAQSEGTGALTSIGVAGATPTAGIDGTVNIYGGVINATGGNGKDGAKGTTSSKTGKAGSNGACGINGTVSIYGGAITATGGKGGNGGKAYSTSYSGGNGGNGGIAINGTVTVSGGRLILNGGNGGKLGTGKANKSKDGSAGAILGGTVALSGGTFNAKPEYKWLAEGFGIENVDNLWSVAGVKYNKIDAVAPTLESEGNIEYYVGTNGKYYKYENEEYSEIDENTWVIPKLVPCMVSITADQGGAIRVLVDYNENEGEGSGTELTNGAQVAPGTVLTIFRTPLAGYTLNGEAVETISVNEDVEIKLETTRKTYNLNITAENGSYTTNDIDVNAVPYGTKVKFTAGDPVSAEYKFIGWYQTNGKQLTTNKEYTVNITSNYAIEARFQKTSGVVTFMSNRNVVGMVTKTAAEFTAADFPATPSASYGYEFNGWDKTVDEVRAALADGNITVNAIFVPIQKSFTVTIYNGESETPETIECTESTMITRVAAEVDGKSFAYWKLNGMIFSYNRKASYTAIESGELRAVYDSEAVKAVGTATIRTAKYNVDTQKLTINAYLTVPDGCVIESAGLVASSLTDYNPATDGDLTWDNATYKKASTTAVGKCAPVNYTWNKSSVKPSDVWYVRARITYKDTNNVTQEIYGDLISVTAGCDYDYAERGTATIRTKTYNSSTKKATFNAYLTVPEDAVIVNAGLVAVSGSNFNPETTILTNANAEFVKFSAVAVGKNAPVNYTWNKSKVNIGDTWYVRAYLVYTLNGVEHTVYGELVKLDAE